MFKKVSCLPQIQRKRHWPLNFLKIIGRCSIPTLMRTMFRCFGGSKQNYRLLYEESHVKLEPSSQCYPSKLFDFTKIWLVGSWTETSLATGNKTFQKSPNFGLPFPGLSLERGEAITFTLSKNQTVTKWFKIFLHFKLEELLRSQKVEE